MMLLEQQRSSVEKYEDDIENPTNTKSIENPKETNDNLEDIACKQTVNETADTENNIKEDYDENLQDPRQTPNNVCK